VQPLEPCAVMIEQRTELARPPGDLELRIGQAKASVWKRSPPPTRTQQTHSRALDPPGADDVHGDAEEVDDVDERPGRFEGSALAVELELDGAVAEGVKGHELGRDPPGKGIVENAAAEHDPALEEPLLEPGAIGFEIHSSSLCGARARRHSRR
jgi:hypothetical protein